MGISMNAKLIFCVEYDELAEEGWQWEDLLAAAGAITPAQYDEIATVAPAVALPAEPGSSHLAVVEMKGAVEITDEQLAQAMADAECDIGESSWHYLTESERIQWVSAAAVARKHLKGGV